MFRKHNLTRKNIKNEYSISTTNHESTIITSTNIGNKAGADLEITATAPQVLKLNNIQFPASDGNNNQLLSTNGSGILSWIDNISGELINDTTPQLSANLDLNNNDLTGTGNLNITGSIQCSSSITCSDITVNGSTTHLNTSTLNVDDPLIFLAENNNANTIDIGFYGKFDDGSIKYSGLIRDASVGKFKLFETSTEPTTIVSDIVLKDLEINDLECNSITSGTWSGSNLTKSQITDLTTDLSTLTNNISSNDSDISSLNSSVSSMNSSISNNTNSISNNTSSISSNTSSISSNTTNISTNSSKWSIVDSDIVRASGNVGIGTNNPAYKLEVNGLIGFTSGDGDKLNLTYVQDGPKISHSNGWSVDMYAGRESIASQTGQFRWFTVDNSAWIERMRMTNAGNVGIGTDNPSEKLHVYSGNIRCEDLFLNSIDIVDNVISTHHSEDIILDTARDLIVKTDGTEIARFEDNGVFECNSISVVRPSNQAFIDCSGFVSGSGSMTSGIRCASLGYREHGFYFIPDSLSANHSKHWLIGTKYADDNDNLGFLFTANHGGAWLQSLTLESSGNVGIANTNPSQLFQVNNAYCNGSTWFDSSDKNLKKNIRDLEYGLKEIDLIKPRRFKWKDTDKVDVGFVAQELQKIIPEAVDDIGTAISMKSILAVLVRAVQEINEHLNI